MYNNFKIQFLFNQFSQMFREHVFETSTRRKLGVVQLTNMIEILPTKTANRNITISVHMYEN